MQPEYGAVFRTNFLNSKLYKKVKYAVTVLKVQISVVAYIYCML